MGKVIGVLNQKGGVGKSTLTMLLATNLYFGHNKNRDPNFVAVYDGDIPQHSISNFRKTEKNQMKKKMEKNNLYHLRKYQSHYYDDFQPLTIYSGKLIDIHGKFDSLRKKHDYTFVDVVGTLFTPGYDQDFIKSFDYIIIPTNLDYEVFRSTLNFAKNLIHPISQKQKMKYKILLNGIDGREVNKATQTQKSLESAGFSVSNNIVKKLKKYSTLYIDNSSTGILSSIFPKYDVTVEKVIDELINDNK